MNRCLVWTGWVELVFIFAFRIFELVFGSGMKDGGKEQEERSRCSPSDLSLANDEANAAAIS